MHTSRPIILISGYTAAGKTTHAQLLAAHLGYEYLGASKIRRDLIESAGGPDAQEWDPSVDLKRRRSFQSDRVLDHIINQKIESSPTPLVVDAWLQPWLCAAKEAIRVWIESSAKSRNMKATVTHLRNDSTIPEDIAAQIRRKDEFSHWIFSRLYKIDFCPDPQLFDLILNNSAYITQPTIAASNVGIEQFESVLEKAIEELCDQRQISLKIASCATHKPVQPMSAGLTGRCG